MPNTDDNSHQTKPRRTLGMQLYGFVGRGFSRDITDRRTTGFSR
jgi:hypothetical protein